MTTCSVFGGVGNGGGFAPFAGAVRDARNEAEGGGLAKRGRLRPLAGRRPGARSAELLRPDEDDLGARIVASASSRPPA